ncbi:nitroreductase family protein [Candidatus Avelusimicrobium gallicola]|uniref:Nitroreductase domain-containing protein n=1 Tax=Candidatus Avelusimicrobium gallicola TaxID=2562704 RepID=A0A1Y4DAM7_9BACT|nr:nitroreductase family protein [Elusimicrobium sp. An273]OUO56106.1 hypothetical protein B5F75_05655 [Elusimicrobium sp. An273]
MELKTDCFFQAVQNRRSRYALEAKSPIADDEIIRLVQESVRHAPSAFNSQGTRAVLLFGKRHSEFWALVLAELRRRVPADKFAPTEQKIASFAAAYGTVLFFEDWDTVEDLQRKFPTYQENFPLWAYQANALAEYVVWTALEQAGLGASLQHYNPLVDQAVQKTFDIPKNWKLIAQMPFGTPAAPAAEKTFLPIETRVKVLQ